MLYAPDRHIMSYLRARFNRFQRIVRGTKLLSRNRIESAGGSGFGCVCRRFEVKMFSGRYANALERF